MTDTPSAAELIARARMMLPTLAARAAQGERDRCVARETIAEMQAAGLFRVLQAKRWGGYELDVGTCFEIEMALGEADMSVAWVYGVVGAAPLAAGALRRPRGAGRLGQGPTTLICSSLMPAGTATPAEGGFRHQRPLEICERLRSLRLGVSRWHRADAARCARGAAHLPSATQRLRDRRHLARAGAQGHRQPRHRGARTRSCRSIAREKYLRQFPRLRSGAFASTPGRSTGCRSARCSSAASRPARSARCRACSTPTSTTASCASAGCTATAASEDPLIQLTCAEVACAIDEMKTILHRNFSTLEDLRCARRDAAAQAAHRVQVPQSPAVAERCSVLAARLFKAAGTAGIFADQPFGRHPRRHQRRPPAHLEPVRADGRSFGATLFGVETTRTWCCRCMAGQRSGMVSRYIAALASRLLGCADGLRRAQDFPTRPITIVVPTGPGGGMEMVARMLCAETRAGVRQAVRDREPAGRRHQHRRGRGRARGARRPHAADGATSSTMAINASIYKSLPFDPIKDLMPVAAHTARVPFVLVVNPVVAGADRGRPGRARQGQARHAQLRHLRHRHRLAPVRRAVQDARPASKSPTCPTRAWCSRSTTCSAGICSSCSAICRRRCR